MKRFYYFVACTMSALVCSCTSERKGSIEGTITGAKGELLVLEHLTNGRADLVDTLRLDESGKFSFKPVVEQGPDFFNLRINNKSVTLVIDTLLSPLTVNAELKTMVNHYAVNGNEENENLQKAAILTNQFRTDVFNLQDAYRNKTLSDEVYVDSVNSLLKNYKDAATKDFIFVNPASPASYYLLYQTVGGLVIFDPLDAQDNRIYGAVATVWKYNYPNSPRCSYLEKKTVEGQNARRRALDSQTKLDSMIEVCNYFDISLPNHKDEIVSLSSLVHNNVVLIDFTLYALDTSPAHNMAIQKVYSKYHDKGFDVYQVCCDLDEYENFWKVAASNIPWTVVRDKKAVLLNNGSIVSPVLRQYNVQSIPTGYLLGKDGSLTTRIENVQDLENEVNKLLSK